MNRELTREQRDALWSDIVEYELRMDFGDVLRTLERGTGEEARGLAQQFRDGFRLLDDLGWDRIDPRDRYELTLPEAELARIVGRLFDLAEGQLAAARGCFDRAEYYPQSDEEWEEHVDSERRVIDHDLDVRSACLTIAPELAGGGA